MTLECLLRTAGNNGFVTIESEAKGLGYIIDPRDKKRIMLASASGGMIVTRKQLRAIALEAGEIMEVFD